MGANVMGRILRLRHSVYNQAEVESEYQEKAYVCVRPSGPQGFARCAQIFPDVRLREKFASRSSDLRRLNGVNAKNVQRRAALERAEIYYAAHPGSPSAVRRPRISVRSGTWIALLGRSVQDGIAGFGPTVERALHAFDMQYRSILRPPSNLDRAA